MFVSLRSATCIPIMSNMPHACSTTDETTSKPFGPRGHSTQSTTSSCLYNAVHHFTFFHNRPAIISPAGRPTLGANCNAPRRSRRRVAITTGSLVYYGVLLAGIETSTWTPAQIRHGRKLRPFRPTAATMLPGPFTDTASLITIN